MRFTLIFILCFIGLNASAQLQLQFWKRKPKPQPVVLTAVQALPSQIDMATTKLPNGLPGQRLNYSVFCLELAEDAILKEAKHNMRFRIYNVASYNFSDLAALYLQQNRFSEAKWYLLQSNTIARQAENTRHLLDNLMILADIKNKIGEVPLALMDLQEAHDVAVDKGMLSDLAIINKKIKYLQTNKILAAKVELRYADAVEVANSKTAVN
ncbi:MAG: tetratricopeptide repeat protein [Mucilaginibacter sp.]|nr:tetratricopeptide repeat protein [Mucilaginibacter sp.]